MSRCEEAYACLLTEVRARGLAMSADERIGERDAATLLNYAPRWFAQMRHEGSGPAFYRLGVGGAKVSYRLQDLAMWIESRLDRASLPSSGNHR